MPSPKAVRTRGPRTPDERATDAAQSTATLFEKLPPSHFADGYLKPIAALLRFVTSTQYLDPGVRLRDVRALDEIERRFLDAAEKFERDFELMPVRQAVEAVRLIENVRRDIRREKERQAAAFDGGDDA